jgi:hypothetical protein
LPDILLQRRTIKRQEHTPKHAFVNMSGCGTDLRNRRLTGWRTEEFGSAASKPAPFAEKQNAKDAAPARSMRGAMEEV